MTTMFEIECAKEWYDAIVAGDKVVEGRPAKVDPKKKTVMDLRIGELVKLVRGNSDKTVTDEGAVLRITYLKQYPTFRKMIKKETLARILPGKETIDDGIAVYRQWYNEEKEKKNGVLAIGVEVLFKTSRESSV